MMFLHRAGHNSQAQKVLKSLELGLPTSSSQYKHFLQGRHARAGFSQSIGQQVEYTPVAQLPERSRSLKNIDTV